MNQQVDEDLIPDEAEADLVEHDDEVDEQLDWEEALEEEYGDLEEPMEEKRSRAMGPGFSKQKQVMEENQFYRGDIKRQVKLNDQGQK